MVRSTWAWAPIKSTTPLPHQKKYTHNDSFYSLGINRVKYKKKIYSSISFYVTSFFLSVPKKCHIYLYGKYLKVKKFLIIFGLT